MVAISFGLLVWADLRDRPGTALWLLRAASVLLAVGVAYVLDDAAAAFTGSSPTRLGIRRAVPVAVVLTATAAAWAALLAYGAVVATEPVPAAGLTVELAALLALALALAALYGGVAAGPALVVAVLVMARLPERWSLFGGSPGDATWSAAHQRWVLLLVVAFTTVVWTSRDPASRRRVLT